MNSCDWIPFELLLATLFSSLVGSLHCVGMCGPFAILATGLNRDKDSGSSRLARMGSYHIGRLATYLMMGAVLLGLGSLVQASLGSFSSLVMGWVFGLLLIAIGLIRLRPFLAFNGNSSRSKKPSNTVIHSRWLSRWMKGIISLRKWYSVGPVLLSSFLWGLTSTLIPCGWLYIFVIAAAAAPSPTETIMVLVAFWVGTLPLLSMATWSWGVLSPQWRGMAQPLAAGCIIGFGIITIIDRSSSDLSAVGYENSVTAKPRTALERIRFALSIDLPCCKAPNNDELGQGDPSCR
jgi:uncharacterized protein